MNSLYFNATYEMGIYFSYSAAFLNIYKNVECNSDPHSSHATQTGKVKKSFHGNKKKSKIKNGEKLH